MTHAANDQPNVFEFFERFPTEELARDYLIRARWPNGAICPHCGHDQVYTINGGKLFRCKHKKCMKQFSVRIGTVMEDSPIPLRKWLFAMYVFGIHSKGVASTKIAELVGVTQKSAWFMSHRLREASADDGIVLDGVVEVDEAYFGGRESNKHKNKKLKAGRGPIGKTAIVGLKSRSGNAVAMPVESVDANTVSGIVNKRVADGSQVYTNESKVYNKVAKPHETVNHSAGEYVKGDVHTNSIESVWALMKRSHKGVYHYWSRKHISRYVAEISKRQSTMKELPAFDGGDGSSITKTRMFMAGFEGRRFTYRKLVNG